jgi:hypothetical protein
MPQHPTLPKTRKMMALYTAAAKKAIPHLEKAQPATLMTIRLRASIYYLKTQKIPAGLAGLKS